jgi:uncharacterized protein (DUF427 family)
MARPQRSKPCLGQESVWDYPRPPRAEETAKSILVVINGVTIAETQRAKRVLEMSHPPAYHSPPEDVRAEYLTPTQHRTFCEFKGAARYYTIRVGNRVAENGSWYYPEPGPGYEGLRGAIACYPSTMDVRFVDGERARPQAGNFYGG